ncbi:MAG: MFS transporter [Candidatus Woesearchaeota archaeon]
MIDSKYSRNVWIVYVFNVLKGMMFFLPIYTLYVQQELFTAVNVALIISVQTFFGMIFEIPTGAIADLFGRKNTLILSGFISLVALFFLSIGGSLWMFMLFAVISALSGSLISGTDTALLFDSLKASRKETNFQKIITWNVGAWQVGAIIGSLIGGLLATISLKMPVYYTFIPFGLALFLTFFIVEPPYKKESHKNVFLHMRNTSKLLVSNGLLLLFFSTILIFAFSEVTYEFNPILLDFKNIPIIYFGFISALCYGIGFLASIASSHYLNKKFGDKTMLLVSVIGSPLSIVFATLTDGLWVAVFLVFSSVFFSIRLPIMMDWYNRNTPSKNRATMLSIASFGSQLGMAMFAPLFGYIVDLYDIAFAIRISTVLAIVAIILIVLFREKR